MTSPFAEVIGDPVEHSKSPLIHAFWLKQAGIAADYRVTRVERAGLAAFLAERRGDQAWLGCNVTMPLKLDAAALADEVSDLAVTAGAANLLLPRDGRIVAGNTDVGAVRSVLEPRLATGAAGGITLLGNGGAARAALVALHLAGIHGVRIQARDVSEAYKLAVEFGLELEPVGFDAPVDTAGLINATPLGMAGWAPIAIDIAAMPANGWVFDLVTAPARTALLEAAAARGLATFDGLAMLVEQAAASFAFFFGQNPPRGDDAQLMASLRA